MPKKFHSIIFILSLCTFTSSALAEQQVVGWIEQVAVNGGFLMHAKIDSGADNSSINLVNPEYYEKEDTRWVRFSVTNREGETHQFDKPIVKTTSVKTKDGGRQKRDVIELSLCLGAIQKLVRVNLVDRSHFKYQLLVGRSYLSPDFLIDPSQKYMVKPHCDGKN